MKISTTNLIQGLVVRYPALKVIESNLTEAVSALIQLYSQGGKLLVCGNGGSASDALHIVGELMKDFVLSRPLPDVDKNAILNSGEYGNYIVENLQVAYPAIALVGSTALETAYANDRAPDLAFAQQVYGLGNAGDILLGISTSGNSKNVIYATQVAKAKGLKTIALTGESGGKLRGFCDILLNVPESETYKVQELHLPIYHMLCLAVENEFSNKTV